tara:strand:+ start:912 stop:1079 length:168 start_codon:yes stop_codon:yes gene_type:complete
MKINNILIVLGEPQSIFSEILFKYFSSKKFLKNKKKNNFNWKHKDITKTNKTIKI